MAPSARLTTAQRYIANFGTLDPQTLAPLLAENYHHEFAPASLNPPGPFDKQGMLEHNARLRDIMSGFPVTAKEYVESESSNQVTVWATSQTVFRDEVKDKGVAEKEWEYQGEYVFMLWMEEGGERIERVVEFLDSKGTERLMGLMRRARGNREGQGI
ncbi:hypothetical protein AJ79_05354 [Helicocarpus griseus UAMH5409]|uniref:SnoaL-like domain-containing protein n=1 Tax=Helicocarpus griseus UAMH5409 TaxID=1447875 RepID=A0A2B7XNY3_9EURO|nr:hypothetical protein AJ79_05354 [Helicocarpus griseus UAMH5409]